MVVYGFNAFWTTDSAANTPMVYRLIRSSSVVSWIKAWIGGVATLQHVAQMSWEFSRSLYLHYLPSQQRLIQYSCCVACMCCLLLITERYPDTGYMLKPNRRGLKYQVNSSLPLYITGEITFCAQDWSGVSITFVLCNYLFYTFACCNVDSWYLFCIDFYCHPFRIRQTCGQVAPCKFHSLAQRRGIWMHLTVPSL